MPVIASTGAMLVIGHKAPMEVSAIACRIQSLNQRRRAGIPETSFWAPAMPSWRHHSLWPELTAFQQATLLPPTMRSVCR